MQETGKKQKVYHVFEQVAVRYDRANKRISLGQEVSWKKACIQQVCQHLPTQGRVLDVCCGTGDIALGIAKRRSDCYVWGLDFSPSMLHIARTKDKKKIVTWQQGDATKLPYDNEYFDSAVISFGLRNTTNYQCVLEEMSRVIRPQGMVWCLDSLLPKSAWIYPFYEFYFRYIMPILGGGIHYRKEYQWLWESTQAFLSADALQTLFSHVGLERLEQRSYMFGACILQGGKKI